MGDGGDFDALLLDVSNRFEAAENKAAIVGWTAGAAFAIITAEWFIHLPLLDALLGFPIQFLGLVTAVSLGLRYYVEGRGSAAGDLADVVGRVAAQLPGLGKN